MSEDKDHHKHRDNCKDKDKEYHRSNKNKKHTFFGMHSELYEDNREILKDNKEIIKDNAEILKDNKEVLKDNRDSLEKSNSDAVLNIKTKDQSLKVDKSIMFTSYGFFSNIAELVDNQITEYDLSIYDSETIINLVNITYGFGFDITKQDNKQLINIIKLYDYLMPTNDSLDSQMMLLSDKIVENAKEPYAILHLLDGNDNKYFQNAITKIINKYEHEICAYVYGNMDKIILGNRGHTQLEHLSHKTKQLISEKVNRMMYYDMPYLHNMLSYKAKSEFMRFCIGNKFYVCVKNIRQSKLDSTNKEYIIDVHLSKEKTHEKIEDMGHGSYTDKHLSEMDTAVTNTLIGNNRTMFKEFRVKYKYFNFIGIIQEHNNYKIQIKLNIIPYSIGDTLDQLRYEVYSNDPFKTEIMDALIYTLAEKTNNDTTSSTKK